MRDNLFRREVLMAQQDHFFGDPVFYQPLSLRALLLSALTFFAIITGFVSLAGIKQTEQVRGYIHATNGDVKVYSNRSGVIQQIHVRNGQLVSQGEALASVIEPGYNESGKAAKQAHIHRLEQQISQIEDRLLLSAERQRLAKDQSQQQQAALGEELVIRRVESDLTVIQLAMAEDEYSRLEQLHMRGTISDSELAQGKSSLVLMKKNFQGMQMALQTTNRMLQNSAHELAKELTRLKDEAIALQINLSQLQQRREEVQYEHQFALTAPVSGRVTNLLSTNGDQLDPRRPFVSIVADSPAYEAQMFVPSRALGKVATGQKVLLNYDAFPFQQYGSYEAVVSSIASSAIDPREYLIPLDVNEPVYLIKAVLPPEQDALSLRAGMQFSAQLVTGQRTIIEGIFEPLTSLARRL